MRLFETLWLKAFSFKPISFTGGCEFNPCLFFTMFLPLYFALNTTSIWWKAEVYNSRNVVSILWTEEKYLMMSRKKWIWLLISFTSSLQVSFPMTLSPFVWFFLIILYFISVIVYRISWFVTNVAKTVIESSSLTFTDLLQK